jgi:hypothetical protein
MLSCSPCAQSAPLRRATQEPLPLVTRVSVCTPSCAQGIKRKESSTMPFYVYRIHGPRKVEHLDTREKYQEAKKIVRELRGEPGISDPSMIRMIFAKTTIEAEKLLTTPRDERVIGED